MYSRQAPYCVRTSRSLVPLPTIRSSSCSSLAVVAMHFDPVRCLRFEAFLHALKYAVRSSGPTIEPFELISREYSKRALQHRVRRAFQPERPGLDDRLVVSDGVARLRMFCTADLIVSDG